MLCCVVASAFQSYSAPTFETGARGADGPQKDNSETDHSLTRTCAAHKR